jgi:signal transduction histidine kinase
MNPAELKLRVENETTGDLLWDKPDVHPSELGVGMRSMQERVRHLGGHLDFHIGKNRTVLEAVFPLAQAAATTPELIRLTQ